EQVLREHLYVCEDRHEVRVTSPTGGDVQMNVIDDAGAGDAAEVPAEVVTLRAVHLRERREAALPEPVDLERLLVRKVGELANVPVGGDHQVPRRVRELVQEDERVLTAGHDETLLVGGSRRAAEDALRLVVGGRDVFQPPGSPQLPRHVVESTRRKPRGVTSAT